MYVKTEESQICNMQGHRDLSIMLHGAGWVFGGFADSAGHHLEVVRREDYGGVHPLQ